MREGRALRSFEISKRFEELLLDTDFKGLIDIGFDFEVERNSS